MKVDCYCFTSFLPRLPGGHGISHPQKGCRLCAGRLGTRVALRLCELGHVTPFRYSLTCKCFFFLICEMRGWTKWFLRIFSPSQSVIRVRKVWKAKYVPLKTFSQAALSMLTDCTSQSWSVKVGSLEFGTYFPIGVVFKWRLASRASSSNPGIIHNEAEAPHICIGNGRKQYCHNISN